MYDENLVYEYSLNRGTKEKKRETESTAERRPGRGPTRGTVLSFFFLPFHTHIHFRHSLELLPPTLAPFSVLPSPLLCLAPLSFSCRAPAENLHRPSSLPTSRGFASHGSPTLRTMMVGTRRLCDSQSMRGRLTASKPTQKARMPALRHVANANWRAQTAGPTASSAPPPRSAARRPNAAGTGMLLGPAPGLPCMPRAAAPPVTRLEGAGEGCERIKSGRIVTGVATVLYRIVQF